MSNAYKLPDDICRCHDSTCLRHDQCLRWLARKSVTPNGWVTNADSLRDANGECRSFMSIEPDAPFCGGGD